MDVPRFAPGPRPEGTEPVSVPVLVGENVGDNSGNIQTIKDFGQVKLDGDKSFSASASFCGGAGSGQYGTGGGYTGPATDPPQQGAEPTVSFELKTDCKPPAGAKLFAGASEQTVGLADPDGDGTYTGSLTLPAGFYSSNGPFPIDVAILSGTPQDPNHVVKDFGEKVLKDGDRFSASASFCSGGSTGGGTTGSTSGGSTSGGTETGNGGSAVVSGDTSNANKGGGSVDVGGSGSADASSADASSANASSGGAAVQGGASPAAKAPSATSAPAGGVVSSAAKALPSSVASVLPNTGGLALPIAGAVGVLLIAGGLLVRRIFR